MLLSSARFYGTLLLYTSMVSNENFEFTFRRGEKERSFYSRFPFFSSSSRFFAVTMYALLLMTLKTSCESGARVSSNLSEEIEETHAHYELDRVEPWNPELWANRKVSLCVGRLIKCAAYLRREVLLRYHQTKRRGRPYELCNKGNQLRIPQLTMCRKVIADPYSGEEAALDDPGHLLNRLRPVDDRHRRKEH